MQLSYFISEEESSRIIMFLEASLTIKEMVFYTMAMYSRRFSSRIIADLITKWDKSINTNTIMSEVNIWKDFLLERSLIKYIPNINKKTKYYQSLIFNLPNNDIQNYYDILDLLYKKKMANNQIQIDRIKRKEKLKATMSDIPNTLMLNPIFLTTNWDLKDIEVEDFKLEQIKISLNLNIQQGKIPIILGNQEISIEDIIRRRALDQIFLGKYWDQLKLDIKRKLPNYNITIKEMKIKDTKTLTTLFIKVRKDIDNEKKLILYQIKPYKKKIKSYKAYTIDELYKIFGELTFQSCSVNNKPRSRKVEEFVCG